ncbi:hypothetical protein BDZ91DRAFT_800646 [Kalaharituber pfeilii]|nr:hypothetical protein BDZ91DRAFT_800646 [Kalaharituber pfeilii]
MVLTRSQRRAGMGELVAMQANPEPRKRRASSPKKLAIVQDIEEVVNVIAVVEEQVIAVEEVAEVVAAVEEVAEIAAIGQESAAVEVVSAPEAEEVEEICFDFEGARVEQPVTADDVEEESQEEEESAEDSSSDESTSSDSDSESGSEDEGSCHRLVAGLRPAQSQIPVVEDFDFDSEVQEEQEDEDEDDSDTEKVTEKAAEQEEEEEGEEGEQEVPHVPLPRYRFAEPHQVKGILKKQKGGAGMKSYFLEKKDGVKVWKKRGIKWLDEEGTGKQLTWGEVRHHAYQPDSDYEDSDIEDSVIEPENVVRQDGTIRHTPGFASLSRLDAWLANLQGIMDNDDVQANATGTVEFEQDSPATAPSSRTPSPTDDEILPDELWEEWTKEPWELAANDNYNTADADDEYDSSDAPCPELFLYSDGEVDTDNDSELSEADLNLLDEMEADLRVAGSSIVGASDMLDVQSEALLDSRDDNSDLSSIDDDYFEFLSEEFEDSSNVDNLVREPSPVESELSEVYEGYLDELEYELEFEIVEKTETESSPAP